MPKPSIPCISIDGRPLQEGFRGHSYRGIGTYTRELITQLLSHKYDLELSFLIDPTLSTPDILRSERLIAIERSPRAARNSGLDPISLEFSMPLRSAKIDLVHFTCHSDASVMIQTPFISTLHDLIPQLRPPSGRTLRQRILSSALHRIEGLILKRSRHIICVSKRTAQDMDKIYGISHNRITVTHLAPRRSLFTEGIDALSSFAALNLPTSYFLSVGGIDENKNTLRTIEAFADVHNIYPSIGLVLAGNIQRGSQYARLCELSTRLGLTSAITELGQVSDAELGWLYKNTLGLVYPSLYEGFGLPVLEGMSCGAPVITSERGSLREIVGDAAVIVDPEDVASLRRAMMKMIEEPVLRDSLISAGLKQARRYSWQKTALLTLECYKRAVSDLNT